VKKFRQIINSMPEAAPARQDALRPSGNEGDDVALVAAAMRGDQRALEQLISRHRAKVFRIASRYGRNSHEIEDIAQTVFVKMCQHLTSYRGDAPFEHWLARIATRACYDQLRARQRNREAALTDLTEDQASWLDRAIAANAQSHIAELEAADAARELARCALDQLTAAERLVLTYLEIEGKSVAEISKLTGWSIANVKVRAFRARRQMKQVVERMLQRQKF
jgi:RNA polymerase sigma-70 factor (ECF subfamily)